MTAIILFARLLSLCAAAWPLRPFGAHRNARLLSLCAAAWPLRPFGAHRGARSTDVSEAPLGGEDSGDARVEPRRFGQRAADGLERSLRDVVEVLAIVHVDVQRDLGVEGEGAEEILEQVEVEIRDPRPPHGHVEHEKRPAGDVHGCVEKRLVHGQERGAVAHDARPVAQRLPERLAETDPDVLDRVMEVHLEVAVSVHGQVHEPVLGPGLEHVAEEGNAGLDLGGAGAVEPDLQHDLRLLGLPLDPPLARHLWRPARRRCRHVWPPVPSMRIAAAAPWPSSPSTLASSARCGPASLRPACAYWMTLMRFTKSSVPSAEAKRAVPPVGST